MNLTDLTEVLRERADVPDSVQQVRLAGVRAKVRASKRRRAVTGAACVVLAFLGAVYAVVPKLVTTSEPAVPVRSFPEYHEGTRLVGQAWGELPSTSVTVRFVPEALDFRLFWMCHIENSRALYVTITVNGKPYGEGTCGPGAASSYVEWAGMGVVVGQPFEATLTVDGEDDGTTSAPATMAPPEAGSFGIAVGAGVPPSDYPFPPRPSTLEPVPRMSTAVLSADPDDPTTRMETSVAWPGTSVLEMQLNTPGRLRVLVNDVQVLDFAHWDYTMGQSQSLSSDKWESSYGLKLAEGDPVRITVVPERVTGDWQVTLSGY
jgi:hypothetical protein